MQLKVWTETASAFPDRSAAGLASELKTDYIPYGEDSPTSAVGSFKIHNGLDL